MLTKISSRQQYGFTFLEIMIVVLIMGIILVLTVLAFPNQDSETFIRQQAENLLTEINEFKFKMQLEGKVGLIKVEENTLTFSSITKNKIQPLSSSKIDDSLKIEFNQKKEDQLYQQKMIAILPSNEQTPFEIKVLSTKQVSDAKPFSINISAKSQGEVQLQVSKI